MFLRGWWQASGALLQFVLSRMCSPGNAIARPCSVGSQVMRRGVGWFLYVGFNMGDL